MKTYFIINSAAGQGKCLNILETNIINAAKSLEADVCIYHTKDSGDAQNFVKNICIENPQSRFIACGGDGTLNEVLNGAVEFNEAQVGVIPIGTGNDFCRNFGQDADFFDIEAQLNGDVISCDAIKYVSYADGKQKTGYCANMFNIGFDCNVADMTASMKKKPFISGSFAYYISILVNLIKKRGANIELRMDGKQIHSGKLLLTSIANGCYCGGGIKSNPLASLQDGLINVNIVKDVSRFKFLKLLPHYMKGDFLSLKNIEKIAVSPKCRCLSVTALCDKLKLCIDGEITEASKAEFEIIPGAFSFVIPTTHKKELAFQ